MRSWLLDPRQSIDACRVPRITGLHSALVSPAEVNVSQPFSALGLACANHGGPECGDEKKPIRSFDDKILPSIFLRPTTSVSTSNLPPQREGNWSWGKPVVP